MPNLKQSTLNFRVRKSTRICEKTTPNQISKVNEEVVDSKSKTKSSVKNNVTPIKRKIKKKLIFSDDEDEENNEDVEEKEKNLCWLSYLQQKDSKVNNKKTPSKTTPKKVKIQDNDDMFKSPKIGKSKDLLNKDGCYEGRAKIALSTSYINQLIGRDTECERIHEFILQNVTSERSSSLYVYGPAGTGKTASVNYVINNLLNDHNFNFININCMNFKTAQLIYEKISNDLNLKPKPTSERFENKCLIREFVCEKNPKKPMTIILLDEIDQLDSRGLEVLHNIFEWTTLPGGRIIVVGLANTLDFTNRNLGQLDLFGLSPVQEIVFKPYKMDQIVKIIEDRIKSLITNNELIEPSAMNLCARKIASCTGDMRKALSVCQSACDLAESHKVDMSLSQNTHHLAESHKVDMSPLKITSDDGLNPGSPRKIKNIKKVDISQIMTIINQLDQLMEQKQLIKSNNKNKN